MDYAFCFKCKMLFEDKDSIYFHGACPRCGTAGRDPEYLLVNLFKRCEQKDKEYLEYLLGQRILRPE